MTPLLQQGTVILLSAPTPSQPSAPTYFITLSKVYGPIKGEGWLCWTMQGNYVLVSHFESYLAKVKFILDQERLEHFLLQFGEL